MPEMNDLQRKSMNYSLHQLFNNLFGDVFRWWSNGAVVVEGTRSWNFLLFVVSSMYQTEQTFYSLPPLYLKKKKSKCTWSKHPFCSTKSTMLSVVKHLEVFRKNCKRSLFLVRLNKSWVNSYGSDFFFPPPRIKQTPSGGGGEGKKKSPDNYKPSSPQWCKQKQENATETGSSEAGNGGDGVKDEEAWPHWEPALWMALSLNVLMEVLSLSSALCAACLDGKVARMV